MKIMGHDISIRELLSSLREMEKVFTEHGDEIRAKGAQVQASVASVPRVREVTQDMRLEAATAPAGSLFRKSMEGYVARLEQALEGTDDKPA